MDHEVTPDMSGQATHGQQKNNTTIHKEKAMNKENFIR